MGLTQAVGFGGGTCPACACHAGVVIGESTAGEERRLESSRVGSSCGCHTGG